MKDSNLATLSFTKEPGLVTLTIGAVQESIYACKGQVLFHILGNILT